MLLTFQVCGKGVLLTFYLHSSGPCVCQSGAQWQGDCDWFYFIFMLNKLMLMQTTLLHLPWGSLETGKGAPLCATLSYLVSIYCVSSAETSPLYRLQWGPCPLTSASGVTGFMEFCFSRYISLSCHPGNIWPVELVGMTCPTLWPDPSKDPVIREMYQETESRAFWSCFWGLNTLPLLLFCFVLLF